MALHKAAQLRLIEKEKNKSPSYAMRISLQINKVVWSMIVDGKSFAEAEINDMIYDFDRDSKDVGVAQFTTKKFVVRNCLPNAKSDMLLSAWNPPTEWGNVRTKMPLNSVTGNVNIPECEPEMTWKRLEFSVMLEYVQAHVAPTDVDPGAGLQWLPKIRRSSPKVKRTGALLERVFMPCDIYFWYTWHKGGTPELKFQVMLDVLTNLLFARLPKCKDLKESL